MKPNRSAIRKLKAPCATSASRSTMPLPLPSKLTSDRLGQSTLALPVYRVAEEGGVEQLSRRNVPEKVW
jgi:hypothetical protein